MEFVIRGEAEVMMWRLVVDFLTKSLVAILTNLNRKARRIRRAIGKQVSIEFKHPKARFEPFDWGVEEIDPSRRRFRIIDCDHLCLEIEDLDYGKVHWIPLDKALIASVSKDPLLRLEVLE